MFKRLAILHILGIVVVACILLFSAFRAPGMLLYSDSMPLTLNAENAKNLASSTFYQKNLTYNPTFIAVNLLPYIFQSSAAQALDGVVNLSVVWLGIPFIAFLIAYYLFFANTGNSPTSSFFLTLLFIGSLLNLHMLIGGVVAIYFSLIGSLAILGGFIKLLETNKSKFLWLIVVGSLFATTNIAYCFTTLLVCVVYFCIYSLVYTKELKLMLLPILAKLAAALSFSLLLNMFWILPLALDKAPLSRGTPYGTLLDPIAQAYYWTSPLKNMLFYYNFQDAPEFSAIYQLYVGKLSSFMFLGFLTALFLAFSRRRKDKKANVYFYTYLLVFALSLGSYLSFWAFFVEYVPGWFFLRSAPLRFYPFVFLFLSLLAGRALHLTSFARVLACYSIVTLLMVIITNPLAQIKNTVLPDDYKYVTNYFSEQGRSTDIVMVLPELGYSNKHTWRKEKYMYYPFETLIANPLVKISGTSDSVPIMYRDLFSDIVHFEDGIELAGKLSIHYVLVNKDLVGTSVTAANYSSPKLIKVYEGAELILLRVRDEYFTPIISSSEPLTFDKLSPTLYRLQFVKSQADKIEVKLNYPYTNNWVLVANNIEYRPVKNNLSTNTWVLKDTPYTITTAVIYYKNQLYFVYGLYITGLTATLLMLVVIVKTTYKHVRHYYL